MGNLVILYIWAAPIMLAVGVAWTPFAVGITLLIRRRMLSAGHTLAPNPVKTAMLAAAASTLMVFPWVYVMSRMIGKPVHWLIVYSAYIVLYIRWALSPIWLGPLVGISGMFGWNIIPYYPFESSCFLAFFTGMLAVINLVILSLSLNILIRKRSTITRPTELLVFALPNAAYLRPIIYWFVLDMIMIWGGVFILALSFEIATPW